VKIEEGQATWPPFLFLFVCPARVHFGKLLCMDPTKDYGAPSAARGRLLIVLAALLWSTSGAFAKVLTKDTVFQLDVPPVAPLAMAFGRTFFAALALLPTLRRQDISFRPMMLPLFICFAVMNATFVPALALGTAANAIILQYTAPLWVFVASVFWLGEPPDRRSLWALLIGLVGIGVIVWGGRQDAQLGIIAIGLTSGLAYAGVILFLRVLRGSSPRWLTVLNHMVSALVLVPFILDSGMPTASQAVVLFFYGAAQMALPYWLVAKGLRVISPQEAGTITLLEPILNPLWAYFVSGERPSDYTLGGGMFILAALAWRYWPWSSSGQALRSSTEFDAQKAGSQ
jgi:drug/metabolite transporter (DMT)-like permease